MYAQSAATQTHQPVLYDEVLAALRPRSGGYYLDGTLGAAGHAWGMLEANAPDGRLLGLDVDPEAIELAQARLAPFGDRVSIRRTSYAHMADTLAEENWPLLDGILLDLGASSMQFDRPERGFSFSKQGPLDMRFDPDAALNAAMLVNEWSEKELADVIYHYGEEPRARRVARAIVQARPVESSTDLAEVVSGSLRGGKKGIHPATRTFQALRIAVNDELDTLRCALPTALASLKPGGRLAVIAFHSLEDRIVKQFMRRESRDCICPPEQPVCTCGHEASIKEITRRPLRPQAAELNANPRSRSARLRVAEKL
jgi:16S rRNA (cytosine1402-N4)-methyltransferase